MRSILPVVIVFFLSILFCQNVGATRVTLTFDGFGLGGSSNYPYFIGDAYSKYGGVDVLFGASSIGNPETNYFDLIASGAELTFPNSEFYNYQEGWHVYEAEGFYTSVSGSNTALYYGDGGPIIFGAPVSDVGAFFNVYSFDQTFNAYDKDNTLLGSTIIPSTSQPTPDGPIYYELSYDNISYVTLMGGNHFHNMDDFQFTTTYETNPFPDQFLPGSTVQYPENFSPVPEPSTLLLLASGLVGLRLYSRRKARKSLSKTT